MNFIRSLIYAYNKYKKSPKMYINCVFLCFVFGFFVCVCGPKYDYYDSIYLLYCC